MKTKFISLIILTAMSLSGMAQYAERKTIIRRDQKEVVKAIAYSKEDKSVRIPKTADEFFKTVLNTQTVDRFDKKPINYYKDEGYIHESFDQIYNGVPVEGCGYTFHYLNGVMYFAHGRYIRI